MEPPNLTYLVSPGIDNVRLNELFSDAWPNHSTRDFSYLSTNSLDYVCCYSGPLLVGFVNVTWDGDRHAFILDTTVRSDWQRMGVGKRLVEEGIRLAADRGIEWVHVDFEKRLERLYESCGFRATSAGLIHVKTRG